MSVAKPERLGPPGCVVSTSRAASNAGAVHMALRAAAVRVREEVLRNQRRRVLKTRTGGKCRRGFLHPCLGGITMLFRKKPTKSRSAATLGLMSIVAMMVSALPLAGAEVSSDVWADGSALLERPDAGSADWESPTEPIDVSFTDVPIWLAMGCHVAPSGSANTPVAVVSDCDLWELASGIGACFVCITPKLRLLTGLIRGIAKVGGCLKCLERLLDEASDLLNGNETNIEACIRAIGRLF